MKINLIGTVFQSNKESAAIEMRYGKEDGKPIAKFTVAEARKFGRTDDNKLDFWEVTVFGKQAEFVEKNFSKGKPIYITGDAYHTKTDKGTYLNIVASDVDFVPKEYTGGTQAQADPTQAIQSQPVQTQQTPQPAQVQQPVQAQPVQAQQTQAQPVQAQPQAQQTVQQPAPQPAQAPQQSGGFAPPAGFDPFA